MSRRKLTRMPSIRARGVTLFDSARDQLGEYSSVPKTACFEAPSATHSPIGRMSIVLPKSSADICRTPESLAAPPIRKIRE